MSKIIRAEFVHPVSYAAQAKRVVVSDRHVQAEVGEGGITITNGQGVVTHVPMSNVASFRVEEATEEAPKPTKPKRTPRESE